MTKLLAFLLVVPAIYGQSPGAEKLHTGKAIYGAGCAGCHGNDGGGAPEATVGFAKPDSFPDFTRCDQTTAEYDVDYKANVEVIRTWLEADACNVLAVGRNGMHRYNNQDHSMYTAMLTVENIHGAHHDIWSVNVEEEYHEINERPRAPAAMRNGGTGRDAPILPKRPR